MDWSDWKPGDHEAAEIASTPGWLAKRLASQNVRHPDLSNLDLNLIGSILSKQLGKGSAHQTVRKALIEESKASREQAEFLAQFGYSAAMSERDLLSAQETDTQIIWMSGCCDFCDQNEDVALKVGEKFPSGHIMPPACEKCLCCISPNVLN